MRELARTAAATSQPAASLAAIFRALPQPEDAAPLFASLATRSAADRGPPLRDYLHDWTLYNMRTAWRLRGLLYDLGFSDLLLREYARILEDADARTAYRRYISTATAAIPRYHRSFEPEFAERLWQVLGDSERRELAGEWLNAQDQPALSPALWRDVLACANRGLPIDPLAATHDECASRLAKVAVRMGVALIPDRPCIRALLLRFTTEECRSQLLAEAAGLLIRLERDDYAFAADFILRRFLPACTTVAAQIELVARLGRTDVSEAFIDIYGQAVKRALKGPLEADWIAALVAACIRLGQDAGAMTAAAILDRLAGRLAACRDGDRDAVLAAVRCLLDDGTQRYARHELGG